MAWNPQYWLSRLSERAPPAPPERGNPQEFTSSPWQRALEVAGGIKQDLVSGKTGERLLHGADATASVVSALPGMAVAGAAALPWTVIPGETKAADVFENVLELAPKLAPQTQGGQEMLQAAAEPGGLMETIDKPFRWVGDQSADAMKTLGLPAEAQALAGSLGYTAANLIGPTEAAGVAKRSVQAARELPGVVKDAAMESAVASGTSKMFGGRLTPEERQTFQALADQGSAPEEIFAKTGLFEALDGTLRKWFPDADVAVAKDAYPAYMDPNTQGRLTVRESLTGFDPEFVRRYPEVMDQQLVTHDTLKPGNAYARIATGHGPIDINLSAQAMADAAGAWMSPERRMGGISDALHELQHGVDALDTGQTGTSPKAMNAPQELLDAAQTIRQAYGLKEGTIQYDPAIHDARILEIASKPTEELKGAWDKVQKAIGQSKHAKYQRQGYETMARLNSTMYEGGYRTPEDLAFSDIWNTQDANIPEVKQRTPNDLIDVPKDEVWFPPRTKEPGMAPVSVAASLKPYEGSAFRVIDGFEGGAPRGASALDVANNEISRGAGIKLTPALRKQLKDLPADRLMWVGRSPEQLMRTYGPREGFGGLLQSADQVSDVSNWTRGGQVLFESPDDGALVLLPDPNVTTAESVAPKTQAQLDKIRAMSPEHADFVDQLTKYLTPAELARVSTKTVDRLKGFMGEMTSVDDLVNMAFAGKAKKGWYRESAEAIDHLFGDDAQRFTGLLAALSPQTSVESNLENALKVWAAWNKAGRPTDDAAISRILGENVQSSPLPQRSRAALEKMSRRLGIKTRTGTGKKLLLKRLNEFAKESPENADAVKQISVLDAWKNNSLRALKSNGELTLSGPKVDSFMRNLLGDLYEVTNDTWQAKAMNVMQKFFGGAGALHKGEKLGLKGPGYLAGNVRTREAAEQLTKLTGEEWSPAEVQETVWSFVKALSELADEQKLTLEDAWQHPDFTNEKVAGIPDFGTLMRTNPRYSRLLEDAGYGEQIKSLQVRASRFDAEAAKGHPRTLSGGSDAELARRLERGRALNAKGLFEE